MQFAKGPFLKPSQAGYLPIKHGEKANLTPREPTPYTGASLLYVFRPKISMSSARLRPLLPERDVPASIFVPEFVRTPSELFQNLQIVRISDEISGLQRIF